MKYIKQFRYYGTNSPNNYPEINDYYSNLTSGNIFRSYGAISQLGVQAPPGTKFYLNNSLYNITVGATGIFELDLEGYGRITSIRFDRDSISNAALGYDDETLESNDPNDPTHIMIDIVYEGAGVN